LTVVHINTYIYIYIHYTHTTNIYTLYTHIRDMPLHLHAVAAQADGHSHTFTHLWSHEGEYLGKDNVAHESKKDMIAECREPHHPLEVCRVLCSRDDALLLQLLS